MALHDNNLAWVEKSVRGALTGRRRVRVRIRRGRVSTRAG